MHRTETKPLFDTGERQERQWSEAERSFEAARVKYRTECNPAGIRGHDVEWEDFKRRHPDWRTIAPLLTQCIDVIQANREAAKMRNEWTPCWPNWSTFQHQRRWEEGLQPKVLAKKKPEPVAVRPPKPVEVVNPASIEERRRIREEHEAKIGRKLTHEKTSEPAAGEASPRRTESPEGGSQGPTGAAGS